MRLFVTVLCLAWTQLDNVECANILGFFSAPSPSHYIIDVALMKGLAAKGHNASLGSLQIYLLIFTIQLIRMLK